MKKGYLSHYFEGVAVKILSEVEVNTLSSNQHEFNGDESLRKVLGEPIGKVRYDTQFLYLTDHDDAPLIEKGFVTWYDARQKARIERGVERYEYRLYFSENTVLQFANAKDILVIAKRSDNSLVAIIAEAETTIAQQILWLFGLMDLSHPGFSVREELETEQDRIEYASSIILESIGIIVETPEDTLLDDMLEKFPNNLPTTKVFSEYARSTLSDISIHDGYDDVFMAWIEREEILFRIMEKHLIGERLSEGFEDDVDGFLAFSLSVQNRRKSRMGYALENHLHYFFKEIKVEFSRNPYTEGKSNPDFIFPSIEKYHDDNFDSLLLTMLGVKSSCKERWRQILPEADRIELKHLFTLQTAISVNQTNQMDSKNVQLVIPEKLHNTYLAEQQDFLMNLTEFSELLLKNQN